jgi:hypothetical protein
MEEGRRLASQRDDLIAQGVDPALLLVPLLGAGPSVLEELRAKVDNLLGQRYDPETQDFNAGWDSALIAVLTLIDEARS